MKIIFLRHGQTAGNALRRYIGSTDEPLSEIGFQSAAACGRFDAVKKVYVSPMLRARQTASILFPNAELKIEQGLRETDFGAFENRSALDMEADPLYRKWVDEMCETPCPGGDDPAMVKDRVCENIKDIISNAIDLKEDTIMIVAHGGTIMAAMERFALPKLGFYDYSVKNLCGYCADIVFENSVPVFTFPKRFSDISTVI